MATYTVGSGKQFPTIAAAVARANQDAAPDEILIDAGTYRNDFATITQPATLRGVGGMAHIDATTQPGNGKGALVTRADTTLDHIEISGVTVPSGNGAGVRYELGDLVIRGSYLHDNQNGLLANPNAAGTIRIEASEFARNGAGDGFTHNVYVNQVGRLDIEGSYFHEARGGHEVKSRALVTEIDGSRIYNLGGSDSRSVDLSNGGRATITDTVLQQDNGSPNRDLISFGPEGSLHPNSSLTLAGSLAVGDRSTDWLVNNYTGIAVTLTGNDTWGIPQAELLRGPGSVSGHEYLAARPALDTSSPWQAEAEPVEEPPAEEPPPPAPEPVALDWAAIGAVVQDWYDTHGWWASYEQIVGFGQPGQVPPPEPQPEAVDWDALAAAVMANHAATGGWWA